MQRMIFTKNRDFLQVKFKENALILRPGTPQHPFLHRFQKNGFVRMFKRKNKKTAMLTKFQ